MKLKEYALFDRITGEYTFTFKARNDEAMKRIAKSGMMSKEPNVLNTDTADKDIFAIAEFDTETGIVVGEKAPLFVCHVEDLRQELITEIKRRKLEAEQAGAAAEVPEGLSIDE